MKPKVIQILRPQGSSDLMVLCDDGSIWTLRLDGDSYEATVRPSNHHRYFWVRTKGPYED